MGHDDLIKRGWVPPGRAAAAREALRHGLRNDSSKADMRQVMEVALAAINGETFEPFRSVRLGSPRPGRVTVELDDGNSITYRSGDLLVVTDVENDASEDDIPGEMLRARIVASTAFIAVLGVCAPDEDGVLYRVNTPQD